MSLDKRQLLHLIEGLTVVYENGYKTLEDAEKIIHDIYKYSHIGVGDCNNKHKDWMKETEKLYKSLERGILKRLPKEK